MGYGDTVVSVCRQGIFFQARGHSPFAHCVRTEILARAGFDEEFFIFASWTAHVAEIVFIPAQPVFTLIQQGGLIMNKVISETEILPSRTRTHDVRTPPIPHCNLSSFLIEVRYRCVSN
jgi:hypothetical protein